MKKCEKCGKNFSKEDFSNLKYKQSLIGHFADEMDPFNELTICPECIEPEEKEFDIYDKNKDDSPNDRLNLGSKAKANSKKQPK